MAATGYLDACGFNPASGGTGDFVVSTAITGYRTLASAGAVNGAVYSYRAQSSDLSQWEVGSGAYTSGTTTLARSTVGASSTGSKVNFTAPPNVYVTALTSDLQNASLLANGTVATARLGSGTASSSTFLRGDQTWAGIDGSNITSGAVPTARLGSGTSSSTTYLRGDQTWATVQQSRVLLATYTPVSVASVTDTSFSGTYDDYEVIYENISSSSNSVFFGVRLQSGGSFQTSNYNNVITNNDGISITAPTGSSAIINILGSATLGISISNACGYFRIYGVNQTASKKSISGVNTYSQSSVATCQHGGYWSGGNGAITGLQIYMSTNTGTQTGTLSGIIKVYGLS